MSITEKQRDEMLEAAKALMKWLAENFNPHTMAIVHAAHIELLEGIATNSTLEYVDDGDSEGNLSLEVEIRICGSSIEIISDTLWPGGPTGCCV